MINLFLIKSNNDIWKQAQWSTKCISSPKYIQFIGYEYKEQFKSA